MKTPALCSMLLLALLVGPVSAAIIDHVGQNVPTTETPAWGLGGNGIGVTTGGDSETIGGQTFDFWKVDDNGIGDRFYAFNPTDAQKRNPWRMTQIVRVEDTSASGTG